VDFCGDFRAVDLRVVDLRAVDFRAGAFRAGALLVPAEAREERLAVARFPPPLALRDPVDLARPLLALVDLARPLLDPVDLLRALVPDFFPCEPRLRCSAMTTHY
jgi:hypothetical protein